MAMEMNKTEKMRQKFADKALDVEQLEEVAGGIVYTGSAEKLADDSRFLNVLLRGHPDQCDRYGETRAGSLYEKDDISREVSKAWAAVGITCDADTCGNTWYYNDRIGVSQEQARQLAMQRMGKQLKKSDWYWPD